VKNLISSFSYLDYKTNLLTLNNIPLNELIKDVDTPFFLYLPKRFEQNYLALKNSLSKYLPNFQIFYAVKANYLGKILLDAKKLGLGLEVMSLFELLLARKAEYSFDNLVFNGPAKTETELTTYLDNSSDARINVESLNELILIEKIAKKMKIKPRITVRIHPHLSKKTEKRMLIKKSSKLGIDYERAKKLFSFAKDSEFLEPVGVHVHVGTNLSSHEFFDELFDFMNGYIESLRKIGIEIKEANLGGGLAPPNILIRKDFSLYRFAEQVATKFENYKDILFLFEPGRYLVSDSFIAITKILQTKKSWGRKWAFTDIGANSLVPLRYSIYSIVPLVFKGKGQYCNLGGPLCLPVDIITKEAVDFVVDNNDLLAVLNCGAYTLSMSEQFGYPRPPVYELNEKGKLRLIKPSDDIERMVEENFYNLE